MLIAVEALPDVSAVVQQYLAPFLWKALGAIILWVIGVLLIAAAGRVVRRAMRSQGIDPTFSHYIQSALSILLKLILLVAILGIFGVESSSFAAVLAAAGVAIGMAWSGLLANFAAGIFLVVLRPFRVGDAISAAGVTGLVQEIGLFATAIDTTDNIRVFVGNNKLLADNIVNFSTNPLRRLDLRAQLAHGVAVGQVAAALVARLKQIPKVAPAPAPTVDIFELNPMGAVLYVRPYCDPSDYFEVLDATLRAIAEVTGGLPVPAPHSVQHNV